MSSLLFAVNSNEIYDIHYHKVGKPVGFIQGFPQVPVSSIVIPPKISITGSRRNSLTTSGISVSHSNASLQHSNLFSNDREDIIKEKEQYYKDLQNWKKAIYGNRAETIFIFPLPLSLLISLPTYSPKSLIKQRAQKINYKQRAPLPMTYLSLFNTFNQTSTINLFKERPKSLKLTTSDSILKCDNNDDDNQTGNYSHSNSNSDSDDDQNNDIQYPFVNSIDYIKDIEIPGPDFNSKFTNSKSNLEYIKVGDFCVEKPRFGTKLIPQEPLPEFYKDYDDFKESLKSWISVEQVTDEECQHPSSFWAALNGRNKADLAKENEQTEAHSYSQPRSETEIQAENETRNQNENETQKTRSKTNIFKRPERKPKPSIFTSVLYNYLQNPLLNPHILHDHHANKFSSKTDSSNNNSENDNSDSESNDIDSILKDSQNQRSAASSVPHSGLISRNENDISSVTSSNYNDIDDQIIVFKEPLRSLFSFISKASVKRPRQAIPCIKNAQIIMSEFKAGSPHCYDFYNAIEEVSNNKEINIKSFPELGQEPVMKYSISVQDNIKYELMSVTESPVHRYDVFRLFLNALVGLNRYTMEMVIMFMAFPQITSNVAELFKCYGNLTNFNTYKFYCFKSDMSGSFNNLCQFLFEAQMLDAIERFFRKNEKVYHKNNPKFSSSLKKMFSSLKDQRKTVLESATKTLLERCKEIEEDFNRVYDLDEKEFYYFKEKMVNNDNSDDKIYLHINQFNSENDTQQMKDDRKTNQKVHSPLLFSVIHLLLNYLPKEFIRFFEKCKLHLLNWLLLLNYSERYQLGHICAHILCLIVQEASVPQYILMDFLEVMNLKNDSYATRFAFPSLCHLFCQILTLDTKTVLPADHVTLLFTSTLKLTEVQHDCAITLLESLCKIFKRRLKKKDADYMDVFDMFFDSLVVPFNVDKFSNEYLEERMLSSIFNLFPFINSDHQESTFKQVFIPRFVGTDCDKANVAWKVFRKHPSNSSKFNSAKSLINAIIQHIQDTHEKRMTAKRHRISTIKPTLHCEISTPQKALRVSPLITPSASSSSFSSSFFNQNQPSHSPLIQPSPSAQISPIVVSQSTSHQMLPPLATNTSLPISPLVEISPNDREEKVKTELLRKNLSIVSKMHLLLFICGYSESKKNDRSIKSIRITQTVEINALLDDVKDAISKRLPEIYKFKSLVKSVMYAYRLN